MGGRFWCPDDWTGKGETHYLPICQRVREKELWECGWREGWMDEKGLEGERVRMPIKARETRQNLAF